MLAVRNIFPGENGVVIREPLGEIRSMGVCIDEFAIEGDVDVRKGQFHENVKDPESRA